MKVEVNLSPDFIAVSNLESLVQTLAGRIEFLEQRIVYLNDMEKKIDNFEDIIKSRMDA